MDGGSIADKIDYYTIFRVMPPPAKICQKLQFTFKRKILEKLAQNLDTALDQKNN